MEPQPGGARSCRRGAPGGACELNTATESAAPMSLAIHSTTGTRYDLSVPHDETVEGLRKRLSQRLKVPKERLALLHKDTRLSSGKLQEFGVGDGSKLTLVPTVEAGLMSQASRPEQSVMQALESLTETQPPATPGPGRAAGGGFRKYRLILFKRPWHRQGPQSPERGGERPQVSDFLSGRSPLTLALRVGDHMMFVQLQLAAQHAPLQHRHVLAAAAAAAAAARGDSSVATPVSSPCRPVSSAARVPPVSSSPSSPVSPSPVTAGSFRSHAASTTCPEQMDCSPPASSSSTSTPGSSPTPRSRKPGAVIESFVNHAPGVFSGTFSGTLHPNCQDSSGRPRRDIGTILQILNDLLSATRHYQGMPPSLTQLRCHAQCSPASPAPDLTPKTTSCEKLAATSSTSLLQGQSQIRMCKPPGDRLRQTENRATRCKVERLQLLLQQKRLRRKARRDARGPYHWTPSRKAGRSDSSSSGGGGGPSEATGLGLDFEDSVWKPEVNPDIQSEFVVA
ncbi:midnolin isoform X1 [Mus musculus]|uniref:Isoform 2 of Midnolin n=3 Tax=Mus musculus TaxID=10090 RepID=Q3TPJ7-2|nr:midnolin isoform 1 [Mus musculus]XP_006513976.1 midnolin isoform X1 [Mus musculus]AAH34719.1 Midnolin [Mus musculus]EDL31589.1 midnolin, isoform CRA_b [Mus musculus]BAB00638.1 midnolin [Mus musculus musculus]|eukprot:NP_067540.1 midnolin isoform 1 [Mus musculus]